MARQKKLSDPQLRAWVKAGKPIAGKADGDGLTFTLSRAGRASWVLRYKFGGRPRELTIGRYPEVSLEGARKATETLRKQIAAGEDPGATRQADGGELGATFEDLARAWCAQRISANHRRRVLSVLERYAFPRLGKLPREAVEPRHIDAVLRATAKAAPTVANDLLRYLKRCLGWARVRRLVDSNPAADFMGEDAGGREAPRQRALTLDEIRRFLEALTSTPTLGADNEALLRLLLLLGVRKGELIGARWEELDLAAGLWHVPAERTKTATGYTVPLPSAAVRLLEQQQARAGSSAWVFPARRAGVQGRAHVGRDTLNVALRRVDHGLPPFTLHDLRRTMRSGLASLGIAPHIAERCLNHKVGGIESVYNTHDYLPERRAALGQWADLLEATERGGQVVPLRGKRPA